MKKSRITNRAIKRIQTPLNGGKLINLEPEVLLRIKELAEADGRSEKNYIERVLINHVNDIYSNNPQ